MRTWSLTQTSFDQFLGVLDSDRDAAGHKYEGMRIRAVKYFEWRACRGADMLADETLDRIARKLEAGEQIKDLLKYTYGVARLVYFESLKQQVVEDEIDEGLPDPHRYISEPDRRMDCLENCLGRIPPNSRQMILGYYAHQKQAKIDHRKRLAEHFSISVNALRIKAMRIRAALESCVLDCMDRETGETIQSFSSLTSEG
jgi:DNA-directed RNA polymerase specialized sigma24 family protein